MREPLNPDAARGEIARAEQLRGARRLDEARRAAKRVLSAFPEFYVGLHTLGLIEADLGNLDAALLALTKADAVVPGQPITLVALAGVYLKLGHRDIAQRLIEQAIVNGGGDVGAFLTLGEIRRDDRDYEAALSAYDQALDLEPDWRIARLCRAVVLTQLGRNEESRAELATLLERNPEDFEAAAAFAALPRGLIDRDISQFLDRFPEPSPDASRPDDAKRMFFRANVHDRLGNHEEAWRWLRDANALVHHSIADKSRQNADWQRESLKSLRGMKPKGAEASADWKTSLFILGASRSGKTTAEALLARSPLIRAGYENPGFKHAVNETFQTHGFVPTFQLSLLPKPLEAFFRDRYAREIERRAGEADIFTNTSPVKIHDAARIWQTIPNARFIFVLRDRTDLALRIFQTHYSSANFYGYDLASIFEHIDWYAEMIESLADILGDDCMVVRYEDILANPGGFIADAEQLLRTELGISCPESVGGDSGASAPYRNWMELALSEESSVRQRNIA